MKNAALFLFLSLAAGAAGCASQGAAAPSLARADACSLKAVSPASPADRQPASDAPVAAAVQGSQIAACLSGMALSRDGAWSPTTF